MTQLIEAPVLTHDRFKPSQGMYFNVIKGWLNLAFPFFKENKMEMEMKLTQGLSMRVLKNSENIRAVWAEYQKNPDNLFKSLQMFEPVLKNPVKEIHSYLKICEALCGNRNSQFADKVLEMMSKKMGDQTFLTQLFCWISSNLTKVQH